MELTFVPVHASQYIASFAGNVGMGGWQQLIATIPDSRGVGLPFAFKWPRHFSAQHDESFKGPDMF